MNIEAAFPFDWITYLYSHDLELLCLEEAANKLELDGNLNVYFIPQKGLLLQSKEKDTVNSQGLSTVEDK